MAAAPMSKLNFASQTNDGSICTTVNTNHMKNFQTNFCIRNLRQLPESADCYVAEKSNATMDLVGEQTHFSILIKHAVVDACANKWQIDFPPGCFTNTPNYRDVKHDPSIAILFRYSNVIHCEKVEVADFQSILTFLEDMDLLTSGCFTNAPNYRDLKHDPSIAIHFRYSNVIHCEKIEVADLQSILTCLEDMDLLIFGDFTKQNYQNLKHDPSIAVLSRKSNAIRWERWMLPIYRRPQQARYVHYYFSEKAMPCDGVKVDDLQSLMFFEILELVSLLTPMRPRTLTADQGHLSIYNVDGDSYEFAMDVF
ncbi:hypothetical protein T06_13942 [Trichinella sp. T6]|nr:hypothetical protein T06_13942 [Trichinella sp. T6]